MLTIYLAALAFGIVLIGASVLGGAADGAHDHGHDGPLGYHDGPLGHHEGHDGHGHPDHDEAHSGGSHPPRAEILLPRIFSLRFWTYALGAFGMTGLVLTLLKTTPALHVPISLLTGLFVGTAVSWAFRRLQAISAAQPVDSETFIGNEAEVVLAVSPGRVGKIRLRLSDQDLELMARGGADETLAPARRVLVVGMSNGIADVRPFPSANEQS